MEIEKLIYPHTIVYRLREVPLTENPQSILKELITDMVREQQNTIGTLDFCVEVEENQLRRFIYGYLKEYKELARKFVLSIPSTLFSLYLASDYVATWVINRIVQYYNLNPTSNKGLFVGVLTRSVVVTLVYLLWHTKVLKPIFSKLSVTERLEITEMEHSYSNY